MISTEIIHYEIMRTSTNYHNFKDLGIPEGVIIGNPIYIAQDEHTRQYHTIDHKTFVALCSGAWQQDEVMSISYTGNIALIDPATQIVCHIYDTDKTSNDELYVFDQLIASEITKLISRNLGDKP